VASAGRYGRLIGRPPAKGLSLAQAIRLDGEPADHLKIVNSGLLVGPRFGTLRQGNPATFSVTDGGPSGLPEALNRIRGVFIDGINQFEAG